MIAFEINALYFAREGESLDSFLMMRTRHNMTG